MPNITIATQSELKNVINLDLEIIELIEACFKSLATEAVIMPPIMRLDIEKYNGEVDVKTAYLPGLDSFAIKISPGFFDNPKIGLPSVNGLMTLFSSTTGILETVLLDNGYLTDVRTAAAGGVAAKYLSRENATIATVIGSGTQAYLQFKALRLVRAISELRIWGRDAQKANQLCALIREECPGVLVSVSATVEQACRDSDVIITTTPSTQPLIKADYLQAGQHVTAMGSDAEHKNEIEPLALKKADRYVCDRVSQCQVLGELHHLLNIEPETDLSDFPELGDIIAAKKVGRTNDQQITICDLTGTGAQDTAIANHAYAKLKKSQVGHIIES